MILQTENKNIIRSSDEDEYAFSIKTSAKAFGILSSGIYSNKIRAIVRELSANAYDAHKEAGTLDKPFDIHIPNTFDPIFKIRDYGTGIHPDDIKRVYTTYFESTKSNSNDYVGCLGLGSKTPLCYTESFSVVSYYNRKKYFYVMFINEDGIPTVSPIGEEDTDEPNGLEVFFDVKKQDYHTFIHEVEDNFRYYEKSPNIFNATLNIRKMEHSFKNDKWGIRDDDRNNWGINAIMGNISYPINIDNIKGCGEEYAQKRETLSRSMVDIFFNIGDLDVTTSRESISYTKNTTKKIQQALVGIVDEITSIVNEDIQKQENLWNAIKSYANNLRRYKLTDCRDFTFDWRGYHINNCSIYTNTILEKTGTTQKIQDRSKKKSEKKEPYKPLSFVYYSISGRPFKSMRYLHPGMKNVFVLCDSLYALNKKVDYFTGNTPGYDDNSSCEIWAVYNYKGNEDIWNEFHEKVIGHNNPDVLVINSKNLAFVKNASKKKRQLRQKIYKFDSDGCFAQILESDVDTTKDSAYILSGKFTSRDIGSCARRAGIFVSALEALGVKNIPDVYLFHGKDEMKLPPNFIKVNTYFRQVFEKIPTYKDIITEVWHNRTTGTYSLHNIIRGIIADNRSKIKHINKYFPDIKPDIHNRVSSNCYAADQIYDAYKGDEDTINVEMNVKRDARIFELCPMLSFIPHNSYRGLNQRTEEICIDYINQCLV